MKKINVAIVGCGNISDIYLHNLTKIFKNVNVYAVSDLIEENRKEKAEKYSVERIMTFEQIIADEQIDMVLNITTPPVHFDICREALLAGKHVYVEKPLSLTFEQGEELVKIAKEQDVLLGCAPDTFMGAGIQTCRKIIDDGLIDIVIVDNISRHRIPAAFVKLLQKKILALPTTTFRRGKRLKVISDASIPIQIDGEIYDHLPFDVRVIGHSLRVYRP